jgi:two-component system, NarL family, response regulator DesR
LSSRTRPPIRIAVAHGDALYREALHAALRISSGFEVVGTFGDGAALAREAAVLRPGVAILDLDLPGGNGAQLALRLRRTLPDLGVVLLAGPRDAGLLAALPAEGMPNWMYLVNPAAHGITTLLRAVQVTDARLIDPAAPTGVDAVARAPVPHLPGFTARQQAVLGLLVQGLTNRAIADTLGVKEKTIENQLASIYAKVHADADRASFHPRVWLALRYAQARSAGVEAEAA